MISDPGGATLDDMLRDPRAYFARPTDVLQDRRLSRSDRLKLLRQWEQDERALLRATTESGIAGGEQPMLREVQVAIDSLSDMPED